MKLTALAFIGAANAATAFKSCVTTADCGDDTQCCGYATKGLVCSDSTCGTLTAVSGPNVSICNVSATPEDIISTQPDASGANPIYI